MNLAFLNETLELKVDGAPKIAGKLFDNVVAYAVEQSHERKVGYRR